MNADEMRALQAPLKDRYRADPKAGLVTLRAKGALDSAAIACKVETGRALAVAGLHPATGGSGAELCSGDMLLEALVACAGVTLKAVATALSASPMAMSSNRPNRNIRGTISNMPTPTCCSSNSAWRKPPARNISRPAGSRDTIKAGM